jgi:NADPH-dependent curcumin reductase CurA
MPIKPTTYHYQYWREGQVQAEETVFTGIDNWAAAFQSLFTGHNTGGKVVLML